MFRSISQWTLDGTTTNHYKPWHGPLQMITWIITNHYKSPQVYHDMNHHKSQITTNHHKPWHKPPWTMTETSTKHDMNHYKSPQTITWTIMMTQKELCIKPYGFLVIFEVIKCLRCEILRKSEMSRNSVDRKHLHWNKRKIENDMQE